MAPDPLEPQGPTSADGERVLGLVGRMTPVAFARVFRDGLAPAALARLIAALPSDRRDQLHQRAGRVGGSGSGAPGLPAPSRQPTLAEGIRIARTRAGIGQAELARALGVSQSAMSQYERGACEPSAQRLLELLAALPGLAAVLNQRAGQAATAADAHPGPQTPTSSGPT